MVGGVTLGLGSAVLTAILFFLIRKKLTKQKLDENQNNGENQAGT